MGLKSGFYWECVKYAWRGSIEFANAWAPILGALVLWLFSEWKEMKVPLPDTLLGNIGLTLSFLLAGWIVTFGIRLFLLAPAHLYEKTARRTSDLEIAMKPKLVCLFGKDITGCIRPNTKLTFTTISNTGQAHQSVVDTTWYRVAVKASGVGHVSKCSARLTSIKRNSRDWFDGENLALTFAPAELPNSDMKDIYDGTIEHLDLFAISHDNRIILVTKGFPSYPSSVDVANMFSSNADYLFHIIVSSPDSVSIIHEVLLKWRGDWKTAEVSAL